MKYLVTASSGFVGAHFFSQYKNFKGEYNFFSRDKNKSNSNIIYFDYFKNHLNELFFEDIDVIIHIAGFAHTEINSIKLKKVCEELNYEFTRKLVLAANKMHVKKFIFLSSVKAAGNLTGKNLDENAASREIDFYGLSKKKAEDFLLNLSNESDMKIIILRSSLIYGNNMKGNLNYLQKLAKSGYLPRINSTTDSQSMIHVNDVIKSLIFSAENTKIKTGIYIITDGIEYNIEKIFETFRGLSSNNFFNFRTPKVIFFVCSVFGSFLNLFFRFPFTYKSYIKLFSNCSFSSQKIRNFGYNSDYDLYNYINQNK